MPSNVTDWGAAEYLSVLHGLVAIPAGYWLALCTDEPGTGIDGVVLADIEPTDPLYSRKLVPTGIAYWSDPSVDHNVANLQAVDFGVPGIDWGVINHYALCSSETGGEVYSYGEFNVPVYVSSTYEVSVPIGGITVALYNLEPSIVSS